MLKTKSLNSIKGKAGEDCACKFIKKILKYKIIERNYKNPIGEIDIIARDKKTICFVEVKMKTSELFGSPREMVNSFKQQKIKTVAVAYLKSKDLINALVRFDVAEVNDDIVEYIKDAFR